jgi:hypothetical protein
MGISNSVRIFQKVGYYDVDWIYQADDREQRQAV